MEILVGNLATRVATIFDYKSASLAKCHDSHSWHPGIGA